MYALARLSRRSSLAQLDVVSTALDLSLHVVELESDGEPRTAVCPGSTILNIVKSLTICVGGRSDTVFDCGVTSAAVRECLP